MRRPARLLQRITGMIQAGYDVVHRACRPAVDMSVKLLDAEPDIHVTLSQSPACADRPATALRRQAGARSHAQLTDRRRQ
jgi:hypothetical protein